MQITSKEFFCNIDRIPDEDSEEYGSFMDAEWNKIEYGVTVYGEYIPGWLYWHLAHWRIELDWEDPLSKEVKQKMLNPDLRDNEWLIAKYIHQAEKEKKGLMIFGTRRFGKSEFAASYIARSATVYRGTQNVISGGNSVDINLITSKCDKGLNALHPEFRFARVADNWNKEVSFGYKDKQGTRTEYSRILVRNFKDGQDTEAAAGTTPKSFIMDEVGKYPFLQCFEAAKPGFDSKYGWRCSPILTGTGGTFKYGDSAQEIFTNPDAFNFLSVEVPDERRRTGIFIPGSMSLKVPKERVLLTDYLGREPSPELELMIDVTPENGQELIEKNVYEPALKSNDPTSYPKARMYYPTVTDDCFMTDSGNDFPIEEAKQQLKRLEINGITGQYVWLKRGLDGKIIHTFADKGEVPITEFPVKAKTNKIAPIVIWEFPIPNPPYQLYIAGADPYNQSDSEYSDSLGTCVIFKRMLDVTGESYQNMMVASYAARPKTMKEWHENVEMLLEFYNAICFPENEAGTFIQYFDQKNKSHMLADGLDFLKEINPTTSTKSRIKGAAATPKNQAYMHSDMLDYTKEEIQTGVDEDSNPIKKLGITRIPDKMLLREIINYRKGGNFDRIIAFRHALSYAKHLDKYNPIIKYSKPDVQQQQQKPSIKSPFSTSHGAFVHASGPFASRFVPSN